MNQLNESRMQLNDSIMVRCSEFLLPSGSFNEPLQKGEDIEVLQDFEATAAGQPLTIKTGETGTVVHGEADGDITVEFTGHKTEVTVYAEKQKGNVRRSDQEWHAEADRKMGKARCIMFVFYFGFTGVFAYTLYQLAFSGKVEVMQTGYKVDQIEAPSAVICPFNAGEDIILPTDGTPWVEVHKYDKTGEVKLDCEGRDTPDCYMRKCRFDRGCICLDMYNQTLKDHLQRDVSSIGTTGEASENEMVFRERFVIKSNLADPSEDKTLKIGFYDSIDKAPNWFYASQGGYVLGALELQTWTVSDFTWEAIKETFQGDMLAMARTKHIFRFTSQEVAQKKEGSTDLAYEMKNFFVDETVSAESAFSVYTFLFLLFIIVVRSAVIQIFIDVMFPAWKPKTDTTIIREMSVPANYMNDYCGMCCCISCWGTRKDEQSEKLLNP